MADATAVMSALAQPTRYRCFMLLMERAECTSGDMAESLGIPANLMSSHLTILSQAGLVTSRREGRSIVYVAAQGRLLELVGHLVGMASPRHDEQA